VATAPILSDVFKSETGDETLIGRDKPLKFICNVGVLTTGFDAPNVDCIALLRPTQSLTLYHQMIGRGLGARQTRRTASFSITAAMWNASARSTCPILKRLYARRQCRSYGANVQNAGRSLRELTPPARYAANSSS